MQATVRTGNYMRAIIIEEDRFVEVLELMRADAKGIAEHSLLGYDLKDAKLSKAQLEAMSDSIARAMTLSFVRWAQSHGARCIR